LESIEIRLALASLISLIWGGITLRRAMLLALVFMLIFTVNVEAVEIEVKESGFPMPEPRIKPITDKITHELTAIEYYVQSTGASTGIRYRTPTLYVTADNAGGSTATVSIPVSFPPLPPGETRIYKITITRADMEQAGFEAEIFKEYERISIGADLEVYNVNTGSVFRKINNGPIDDVYRQLQELILQYGFSQSHIDDMKTYWIGSLLDLMPIDISQYKYTGQIYRPSLWQIGVPKGDRTESHGYVVQWGLALLDGQHPSFWLAPSGFFWEYNSEISADSPPTGVARPAVAWRHLDRWEITFRNKDAFGIDMELSADKPLHYRLYKNYYYDPATGDITGNDTMDFVEEGVLKPGVTRRPDIKFNGSYYFMALMPTMVSGYWGDIEKLAQDTLYTTRPYFDYPPEELRELAEELVEEFRNSKQ